MKNDLYKEFGDHIILNGHVVPVTIRVETLYDSEYSINDEDFETPEQRSERVRDIEGNNLTPLVIVVKARALGQGGTDYLGGCLIGQYDQVGDIVRDHDMVKTAKENLLAEILDTYARLQKFF